MSQGNRAKSRVSAELDREDRGENELPGRPIPHPAIENQAAEEQVHRRIDYPRLLERVAVLQQVADTQDAEQKHGSPQRIAGAVLGPQERGEHHGQDAAEPQADGDDPH